MNRLVFIAAAVLTTATLGATAWADQNPLPQDTHDSRCMVMGHRVLSTSPRWVQDIDGKHARHLVGADVRIAAEPGMTPEYLTVELRRYLSAPGAGHPTSECVFGVEGSHVEVRSAGDGFVFSITGPDTRSAEEILSRARRLS
jgi:hypothetical protein